VTSQLTRLSAVADILPGYSVKGRVVHDPTGSIQIVMGRHLRNNTAYHYADEDELRIQPPRKTAPYRVGPGDVLFTARGKTNHATLLAQVPEQTIASSTFYIVRARTGLEPAYLAWALNQPAAQAAIAQVRTGAGVAIVQRRAFTQIVIPVPDRETQQHIGRLAELMGRERQLLQRLSDETARHHQMLGHCLWTRLSQPNKPGSPR
jgi:hypothetical protein